MIKIIISGQNVGLFFFYRAILRYFLMSTALVSMYSKLATTALVNHAPSSGIHQEWGQNEVKTAAKDI